MSNYCSTEYVCEGKREELLDLQEKIRRVVYSEVPDEYKSRYWHPWLGGLVHLLGAEPEDAYCRGDISTADFSDGDVPTLYFAVGSANNEMEEVRLLIKRRYPSLRIYCAVICDDGLGWTNDVKGKYFRLGRLPIIPTERP